MDGGQPRWLSDFGEVLVSYWDPIHVDKDTDAVWVSSVNNYVNGLKIDFGLWSRQRYADVTSGPEPDPEFDAGYLVLVDKDRLTTGLPPGPTRPTFRVDLTRLPTSA